MANIQFHAVMIGECGEEFGVSLEAPNRNAAYDALREDYPESRVDSLEDANQCREREERNYRRANRAYENDYYDYD